MPNSENWNEFKQICNELNGDDQPALETSYDLTECNPMISTFDDYIELVIYIPTDNDNYPTPPGIEEATKELLTKHGFPNAEYNTDRDAVTIQVNRDF